MKNFTILLNKKTTHHLMLRILILAWIGIVGLSQPLFSMQPTQEQKEEMAEINIENLSLSIYPNPSQGEDINVLIEGIQQGKTQINLYNTIGSVVFQQTVGETLNRSFQLKINPVTEQIAHGLYFLSITNQNKTVMKKIIIN